VAAGVDQAQLVKVEQLPTQQVEQVAQDLTLGHHGHQQHQQV
jgi:hypothetical protein